LETYQARFIDLALKHDALKFGRFTLKSGRISPYFFNAGAFASGATLAELGRCYAECIVDSGIEFDVLLGPAYKGIPLAAATAVALSDHHGRDVPFAYNRKEAKTHGEGGQLVGAPLEGRVLIIDDVITAGTAVSEVITLIQAAGAKPVGVIIGLDRQERLEGELSAVQTIQNRYDLTVASIINFATLIDYVAQEGHTDNELDRAMRAYRVQYGAH
jgi:orotate phosphoribosyltransferase